MPQVICPLSVVPVRKEPNDRAEMVTQWLFGETAEVLEAKEKWSRLRFHHDGYEGWVDNKQMATVAKAMDPKAPRSVAAFAWYDHHLLSFGAVLSKVQFTSAQDRTSDRLTGPPIERILAVHDQWMDAPYLWGGRTPMGVDCSGLTQALFLIAGISLPRDAYLQAEVGSHVDLIDLAQEGDLAFFDNAEGRIVHVGLVLSEKRILHASGRVRIDAIDQQGIFNAEEKRYTHKLRSLKRVL